MNMRIYASKTFLFFCVLCLPVFVQATESVYHSAHSVLFEVIEDGVVSSKRVSLDIDANETKGSPWAECRISILTINDNKKRVELDNYYCSTDQGTIKDLQIEPDGISFDMIPFPLAPDRPLKLVAVRTTEPGRYNAKVVGLWASLLDKNKLVKIEWRQVRSIKLPYSIIGN